MRLVIKETKYRQILLEAVMTRGGARPNAGRPRLPDDVRKHKVNFWITLAEKEMIKRFIKRVRDEL